MNITTFETFKEPISAVLLFKEPKIVSKPEYLSEEDIELKTRTTTTLMESSITPKEELIRLLKNRKIVIKDEQLFHNLLKKLYQDEIQLITDIVKKLLNEGRSFHIETYETEGDLEDLYFVIHYDGNISDEDVEEDIFKLNEYVREIDKNNVLWFVGFASEIKDV